MAKIKDMCALSSSTDAEDHELLNKDCVLPCDVEAWCSFLKEGLLQI